MQRRREEQAGGPSVEIDGMRCSLSRPVLSTRECRRVASARRQRRCSRAKAARTRKQASRQSEARPGKVSSPGSLAVEEQVCRTRVPVDSPASGPHRGYKSTGDGMKQRFRRCGCDVEGLEVGTRIDARLDVVAKTSESGAATVGSPRYLYFYIRPGCFPPQPPAVSSSRQAACLVRPPPFRKGIGTVPR